MEKLRMFSHIFLMLGLVLVSCSDNGTSKDDDEAVIIGKWNIESYTHTENGSTSAVKLYDDPSCVNKSYFDIKEGGYFEQAIIVVACEYFSSDGTWEFHDKVLRVEVDNEITDYRVLQLTSGRLVLKIGNPDNSTDYYIFTLIKSL